MPNIWSVYACNYNIVVIGMVYRYMTHDPKNYVNPDVFDPDRFIASDGKDAEIDPRTIIFGFGRRFV